MRRTTLLVPPAGTDVGDHCFTDTSTTDTSTGIGTSTSTYVRKLLMRLELSATALCETYIIRQENLLSSPVKCFQ